MSALPNTPTLWPRVLERLEQELPEQQVNTWLRPLQAVEDGKGLCLLAPNRFAVDWIRGNAATRIGDADAAGNRNIVSGRLLQPESDLALRRLRLVARDAE